MNPIFICLISLHIGYIIGYLVNRMNNHFNEFTRKELIDCIEIIKDQKEIIEALKHVGR